MNGIVIKNVNELLKYAVESTKSEMIKTIHFEFEEDVVFDIPDTVYVKYVEDSEDGNNIQDISFRIIGGRMKILHFPFKLHSICGTDVSILTNIAVKNIVVSDTLTGHRITADKIKCRNMLVDYVDCKDIDCKNALGADILVLGDTVFEKIYAKHVRMEKIRDSK